MFFTLNSYIFLLCSDAIIGNQKKCKAKDKGLQNVIVENYLDLYKHIELKTD